MIDVKSISGEVLVSVPILKDAVSHEELMTSDYIQLHWDSDKGDVLPLGAYIEHNEERYSLLEPYSPSRQNEGVFRYSPQFHSRIIRWQKIIVPVYTYNEDGVTVKSRELDWNFTGTPADAMYMVKQALRNELGEEWNTTLGNDLPETITIAAQSSSVWSILSEIAEQCETEWWAEKKAQWLHLSKCNHGVSVDLEVGKNVKVPSTVQSGQEYFTRFYAFGSSRNVTQMESAVQGSIVNKRLTLDPAKYPGGYKDIRGHFSGGVYVSDLRPEEVMVKSLYFDEVYPSSKLTIAEVRKRMRYHTDDDGNYIRIGGTDEEPIYDQYAIWYFKIPGFDFKEEMIIENLELSVAFKSGELRGREFALTYHPKDKKVADKADVDKEFSVKAGEYEITFDESDYLIVPGVSYIIPHDGDEITVFNIEMPQEYKESAYLELERELDKEIDRLTKDNKSYEVDSNPVAFYEGGIDIHLGQSVNFTNNNELLATRVMMVEKHIDYPFEQRIRIGNEIVKGSRQQLKDEVRNVGEEVRRMNKYESSSSVIQKDHSRELMLTMGRYLAMKDTMDMLQGAVEGFTEGINPVTVETMALLVGNEALQFKFVKSRTDFTLIDCPLVYNEQTKQLNAAPCALVHLTLDIDSITAPNVRKNTDYKAWDMEEWHSEIFTDATKKYYVYAVVEANGTAGTYELVPDNAEPIGMRDKLDSLGVYYLLVGILNAEYAETRELLPLYGFTQILPGQITTDVIRSADGSCYFDLANNTIAGRLSFINNNDEVTEIADWSSSINNRINKKADQTALDELESSVDAQIAGFQKQIDGVIETWFYDDEPTLDNAPANGWTEDADKEKHIGDLYYSKAGKAYRFQKDAEGAYYWNPIADEDIAKALEAAQEAQDTADNKRRVFTSTPKPPYDKGDLWTNGTDLYVCNASRSTGSYVSTDWKLATNYTDDTVANNALEKAQDAITDAGSALSAANQAQSDAAAAKKAAEEAEKSAQEAASDAQAAASDAEKAKQEAEAASDRVQEWAEDGVISPLEVQALKNELAQIKADYNEISANLTKYGLTNTTYESAYNSYKGDLDSKITAVSSGSSVGIGSLASLQSDYYTKRTAVLDLIADAAKKVADDAKAKAEDAQEAADNASDLASKAQADADAAKADADAAKAVADEATSKIDGDDYFTEIEKKAIRSLIAEISECTGTLYTENAIVSRRTISGNEWKIVKKGDVATVYDSAGKSYKVPQDEFIGYYGSNLHDAGETVTQMNIEVKKPFTLKLQFLSDDQVRTYSYAAAGPLGKDVTPTYSSSDHEVAEDKNTYTYPYTPKTIVSKDYNIESDTYIQLSFKKRRKEGMYSSTPRTDSAYYKLTNDIFVAQDGDHIVDMAGSFHRYYLLLQQLGYDQIAQSLYNALDKVFVLLKTNKLWEKGTTKLTADFRIALNTYLTDYYGVLALCGFNIMDSKVSDLDYLANAMRDGSTVIEGGLVMTSLVAVGDTETTDADVEAFMNGSDFASDEEHGKLLHALGIPEETAAGSTDLEARAKEAKTRMYEDGTIISQLIELIDGCKLGEDIIIKENGIYLNLTGSIGTILLNKYGIEMKNAAGTNTAYMGHCSGAMIQAFYGKSAFCPISDKGIAIQGEAVNGYAFYSQNGMFAGLRTNVRVVTTAGSTSNRTELDQLDFSVLVSATSGTYYLKLPTSPQVGQEYLIESRGAGLNITASHSVFSTYSGSTTPAGTAITQTGRSLLRLKYYGSSYGWSVTWMNRN